MYAAQEACEFGSRSIAPEHMLLGLIRVDGGLAKRFPQASVELIRKQIRSHTPSREKITFGGDFKFSDEGKQGLIRAVEEADRTGDTQIGTDHLLMGIMSGENSFA
jgi:ATP-dependent Clp protease ATP-binding subunit ClpA